MLVNGQQTGAMPNLPTLRELLLDVLAILWPTACVGCGAADRDCCARCVAEVRAAVPVRRRTMGVPVFVRGEYAGVLRALLVAFKHEHRFGFRRQLGPALRAPLVEAMALARPGRPPLLVAAPSRPTGTRARGFRPVAVLIRSATRGWRIPQRRVLRTTRGRVGQVGLGPAQRRVNAQRIAVRRGAVSAIRGRDIVLVDDILTTGATLFAARETLERAGATVIAIVALCVAERRDTRPAAEGGNGESEWSRLPERRKGAPHWPTA